MAGDQELSLSALSQRVHQLEQKLAQVIVLLSDVYRCNPLRDYLVAGQFKQADQETTRVMLEVIVGGLNSLNRNVNKRNV